jgi:protein TonB
VPDRHRHDEFLRALIFSLIINLVVVFALVTQHRNNRPGPAPAFFVSIAAERPAFPRATSAKVRAITVAKPAKVIITRDPRPVLSSPDTSAHPLLPPPAIAEEALFTPVVPSAGEKTGAGLSLSAGAREIATTEPATGKAGGTPLAGGTYTAPQRVAGEDPVYPPWAERRGWEGRVLLTISINLNGEVEKVGIVETSGYELLDRQAQEAVAAWRFRPARRNGIAVAETVHLPIIYRRTTPGKN